MKQIDIQNILLNENAYFYKTKKRITKSDIEKLFREARDDKYAARIYNSIIRTSLFEAGREIAKYSLDIFEFHSKPSFLKENQDLWEVKTALFMILEYKDFLIIYRKNISGIKSLKHLSEPIDYKVLSNFLIDDNSKFEKIRSTSLNTAENSVHNKTAEATDLKGILTRFGASKMVLDSFRLDNNGEKSTITLNTSRVNSLKVRSDFEDMLFWAVKITNLINIAEELDKINPFIAGFAAPVDFEKEIIKLEIKFLLFRFNSIVELFENGYIDKTYIIEDDNEKKVDLLDLLKPYRKIVQLEKENENKYIKDDISVFVRKKTLTIDCKEFKKVYLEFQGEKWTLNDYLKTKSNYLITFEQPEYAFTQNKIFKDHRLLDGLEVFLETFITKQELININSEKGFNYKKTSTSFSLNSIFNYVDQLLSNKQCVICDDFGNEWGDFISIHDEEISFYHCKYDEESLSASKLEIVFGQAQKNLGNLEITENMILDKEDRWQRNYKIDKTDTNIKRIRRCKDSKKPIDSIKESIRMASSSGNLRRNVFVVINFLSKQELANSLELIKNGKQFKNKGVVLQILWFVNALLSSASEIGVGFKIICKP